MRNLAFLIRGAAPETPRFSAVAPESRHFLWAAFAAQAVPASESALGSHLCVALPSAQVFPEWNLSTQPGNDFSLNGNCPLNSLSHARGSVQSDAIWVLLVPPIMAFLWYLLARAWTGILGTTSSPRVRTWTSSGVWIVMGTLYVVGIAFFVYAHFIKS